MTRTQKVCKDDLAIQLADNHGISITEAKQFIDIFCETLRQGFKDGKKVEFRGFGSFYSVDLKARLGRNPKTGEAVDIPPRTRLCFKPSKEQINLKTS